MLATLQQLYKVFPLIVIANKLKSGWTWVSMTLLTCRTARSVYGPFAHSIQIIGVGWFVAGPAFAQPNRPPEGSGADKDVEWLWKKEFPEDIVDIGWGIHDQDAETNTGTPYPAFIATKKSIRFLGVDGKVRKQRALTSSAPGSIPKAVNVSDNGNFLEIQTILEYRDGASKGQFQVLNATGDIIWEGNTSEILSGYRFISPNGKYVVELPDSSANGVVRLHYQNGQKKTIEITPEYSSTTAYDVPNIAFSADGAKFLLGIQDRTAKGVVLVLFDQDGKEIWHRTLNIQVIHTLKMSPNGSFFTCRGLTLLLQLRLLVLNSSGEVLWQLDKDNGAAAYIFQFIGENYLLIVSGPDKQFRYFDITTGKLIWKYDGGGLPGKLVKATVVSPQLGMIVAVHDPDIYLESIPAPAGSGRRITGRKRVVGSGGDKGLVLALDIMGRERFRKSLKLRYSLEDVTHPSPLRISSDGKFAYVADAEGVKRVPIIHKP